MMRSTLYVRLSRRACVLVYIRIYIRDRAREKVGAEPVLALVAFFASRFFRRGFEDRGRERERERVVCASRKLEFGLRTYIIREIICMYEKGGRERVRALVKRNLHLERNNK